jgi:hypothetical protein
LSNSGAESYELEVPPDTAPGTNFRMPRAEPFDGCFVVVRLRVLPGGRFRARGSDLRTDLPISAARAASGGSEMVPGASERTVRVTIALWPAASRESSTVPRASGRRFDRG